MNQTSPSLSAPDVICIGAGPAGLTAAYLFGKAGKRARVLEKDAQYVGGISRTVKYKGFGFDIGGHRFFSKSKEVDALWDEILGDDFLQRPRKSRIYYGGKFYPYPLEAWETLRQMGILTATRCILSYLHARLRPIQPVKSFEDWIVNHFGRRLYRMFFKTYTEKVWGMECSAISADWAAQRIKGLSLATAIWHALPLPRFKPKDSSRVVKTLIHHFKYPRLGPGMMWERAAEKIAGQGGQVAMGADVMRVEKTATGWQVSYRQDGQIHTATAAHVISSMPLRELVERITPPLPDAVRQAAAQLSYRDFLIVALIVRDRGVFDDNWIYIHEPNVHVGRIQNFKSWSPELVPDLGLNCYGMEYFCFAGDTLWNSTDDALVALATRELIQLGLAAQDDVVEGVVVRQPKAYPVYDKDYQHHIDVIRQGLEACAPGLHVVGRAGMHKYNNQDHAMMTAMLTVKNILSGTTRYDVWRVNNDAEYHEESSGASGERLVPQAH